ncbi:MAG: hypothetical protein RLZZ176_2715, partial [Cyanobacteriota bacterium]
GSILRNNYYGQQQNQYSPILNGQSISSQDFETFMQVGSWIL